MDPFDPDSYFNTEVDAILRDVPANELLGPHETLLDASTDDPLVSQGTFLGGEGLGDAGAGEPQAPQSAEPPGTHPPRRESRTQLLTDHLNRLENHLADTLDLVGQQTLALCKMMSSPCISCHVTDHLG